MVNSARGVERADDGLRVDQAGRVAGRAGEFLAVGEVLEGGVDAGAVEVGAAGLDAVAAGVGDQGLG